MSKSKHGPALFEVIRSETKSGKPGRAILPKWWQEHPADEGARNDDSGVAPAITPPQAAGTGGPLGLGPTPPAPLIELLGGQLRLTLTSVSGAVAMFALFAVLTAAFTLGSRTGRNAGRQEGYRMRDQELAPPAAPDEIDVARAKPIAREVFNGIGASPIAKVEAPADRGASKPRGPASSAKPGGSSAPAVERRAAEAGEPSPPAGATGWTRGCVYVAVQHFQEARDDAVRAQQFLKDNGVETEIVDIGKHGKFALIATRGFRTDDPVQKTALEQYWQRIKSLGQAYWKSGGRYKLEGQLMTLTRDQW